MAAKSKVSPYQIGKYYFIRTVTFSFTGELVAVFDTELVLNKAAWIAETKRFMDSVKNAEFNEVEPYPPEREVVIGRLAVVDACQIDKLPLKQQ